LRCRPTLSVLHVACDQHILKPGKIYAPSILSGGENEHTTGDEEEFELMDGALLTDHGGELRIRTKQGLIAWLV